MLDPHLLSRFLLLAHAISATGLAAWYLGAIPRGASERRFKPLGLYMMVTLVVCLLGWLASFDPRAGLLIPGAKIAGAITATLLMVWAHRVALLPGETPENWPWNLRLCLLAHLGVTFLVPWAYEISTKPTPQTVLSVLSLGTVLWLVFGQIGRLRRKGYYIHWSMAAGVMACLAFGWVLIKQVNEQGWERIEEDLVRQATVLSRALGQPAAGSVQPPMAVDSRFDSALQSVCESSPVIGGAFILRTAGRHSEFVATTFDAEKSPAPHFRAPRVYARSVSPNGPALDLYREEGGEKWITVLSPLEDHPDIADAWAVGLIASSTLVQAELSSTMLATESILLLVALVIYVCIAGYLHGLERVWQRDTLLEASAIVAQRLLHASTTHDIAVWLVDHLHTQLHLVHTSFLLHHPRHGEEGFQLLAAQPAPVPAQPWYPLSRISAPWTEAWSQDGRAEGGLKDLGAPVAGLFPDHSGSAWIISESIIFREKVWGTLILMFPPGSRAIHSEVRSALRSMTTAFAFCLAREERNDHLAAAEERLRTIIDTSPDGFWDADFINDRHYRSAQWWQILGYAAPARQSSHDFENYIEPEDLRQLRADAQESLPPGRHFRRRIYRARHLDGSWRWIETNAVEIRSRHGSAERALGFDRDITERRQYEERLRSAAETAARANQAKSEFLATMSHELRTPLNSVIGFASILDRSTLNSTQRDWVSSMRTSAEQLLGLISEILDFSRIEAGRLELELAPFELRRAAEQALEHFSRQATDKHIALHLLFEPEAQPTWVNGDVLRVRQIITNLVGNAVKFTEEGHVILQVRPGEDDRWEFAVTDTGPGIRPETMPSLFDRFSQIDPSTTRKHGGTGLGLAISRQLARSMQGDIAVQSTPDQGSTFTFTAVLPRVVGKIRRTSGGGVRIERQIALLHPNSTDLAAVESTLFATGCELVPFSQVTPLIDYIKNHPDSTCVLFPRAFRPAILETARQLRETFRDHTPPVQFIGLQPPPPDPALTSPFDVQLPAPLRQKHLIAALGHLSVDTASPFEAEPTTPATNARPFRVLVAEDHPVNREVIGTMLAQLKASADYAENGEVAIELLRQRSYDLALIDIQMPIVDGYGVAEWVHASWHGRWPPPRMVAVTANATRGDRQKCLDANMDDFMTKPITFTALADLISDVQPAHLPLPTQIPSAMTIPPDSASPSPGSLPGDLLIDWVSFDSILGFTNAHEEPEVLRRIIATYETDSVKILDDVSAMSVEDHGEARKLLHKLKGSSGSLAFAGAMSTIKKLHDPMESPPLEERDALLARIRTETAQCVASVRARYPFLNVDPA